MASSNHPGNILAQDTQPGDENEEVNVGQPVSLTEIEDLLYGDDRSTELRLERLRELADELRVRASGDILGNDSNSLLSEIERAIVTLDSKSRRAGEPGALDDDPLDHRETLAPDSDELEEIEEEDIASIEDDTGRAATAEEIDAAKPH